MTIKQNNFKTNNLSYQPFIIITHARSGSNLLVTLLKSHDAIVSFGELFKKNTINFWDNKYSESKMANLLSARDSNPIMFLKKTIFCRYQNSVSAVGFKIFYHHAQTKKLKTVWSYLNSIKNLKIIQLNRENKLSALVSLRIAEKTDQWGLVKGRDLNKIKKNGIYTWGTKNTSHNFKINLNYNECLNFFRKTVRDENKYKTFFKEHKLLEITYEDLTGNMNRTMKTVQEFLGVKVRKLTSPLQKQNKEEIRSIIVNYDSLKKCFKNTKWNKFFND